VIAGPGEVRKVRGDVAGKKRISRITSRKREEKKGDSPETASLDKFL